MNEGPAERFRFSLGRLFLWAALAGTWLGVLVDAASDSIHGRPWFAELLTTMVLICLVAGQFVERRISNTGAHKIEWTLLWVGLGILLAPIAYRLLISD